MNRIIKFRVWSHTNLCWTVYEDFIGDSISSLDRIAKRRNCTLQQFTGLLDKNEREIYEGDIVKESNQSLSLIQYNYGGFYLKSLKGKCLSTRNLESFIGDCENCGTLENSVVIGNIFENQNLLNS